MGGFAVDARGHERFGFLDDLVDFVEVVNGAASLLRWRKECGLEAGPAWLGAGGYVLVIATDAGLERSTKRPAPDHLAVFVGVFDDGCRGAFVLLDPLGARLAQSLALRHKVLGRIGVAEVQDVIEGTGH